MPKSILDHDFLLCVSLELSVYAFCSPSPICELCCLGCIFCCLYSFQTSPSSIYMCLAEGAERVRERRELFVILLCIYPWMFFFCLHKVDGGYNLVMNSMNTNLGLPLTWGQLKIKTEPFNIFLLRINRSINSLSMTTIISNRSIGLRLTFPRSVGEQRKSDFLPSLLLNLFCLFFYCSEMLFSAAAVI